MASTFFTRLFNPILRSSRSISSSVLRPCPCLPRTLQPTARRFAHSIPKPRSPAPSATASSSSSSETKSRKLLEPHYELTFTCVPCGDRSTHIISKQGYHKGSVLITCPSCRNRHVISDHLNIFGNRKITVEDLMREKGQLVKRGTLGEDGDVEFWEDGTMTERRGGSPSGSSSSTEVKNELDTLSEEESATRSREAKDPSSQSAEPINKTPTQFSGTRPSLDSTQSTHHVPSTRRQYSSIKNYSLDWYDSRLGPFGYSSRLPTRPSGPPKRPDAVVKDFDLEDSLRRRHRIPKEEMIEQVKKHLASKRGVDVNSGPQAKCGLEEETSGRLIDEPSALKNDAAEYRTMREHPSRFPKRSKMSRSVKFRKIRNTKKKRRMFSPVPRFVLHEPSYRGIRFYRIDTSDDRPRFIRTGSGYLKKQRRLPGWGNEEDQGLALHERAEQHAAEEDLSGRPPAVSEARRDVPSTNSTEQGQLSRVELSARVQIVVEQKATKLSKRSNAFIRASS